MLGGREIELWGTKGNLAEGGSQGAKEGKEIQIQIMETETNTPED